MPLPVHHIRFRPAPAGRAGLEAVGRPAGLDPAALGRLGRLAEAGCSASGVCCSYTRLPEGGAVAFRIARSPASDEGQAYDMVAVLLPDGEAPAGVDPLGALAEESWLEPAAGGAVLHGARPAPGRLAEFAQSQRQLLPTLLADARALFAAEAGPQILIGAEEGSARLWIELLAASLPPRHARALTFATGAERPYRAVQQIVGLAPEPEFDFSEEELLFTYRVRGTGPRRRSASVSDPWAEIAARLWLADRPELLHDPRLGPPPPFDAAHLAATALLADVELDSAALLAALQWLGVAEHTATVAQSEFDGLAERAGAGAARIAAAVATGGAPPAGFGTAVKRAYLALKRRSNSDPITALAVQAGRLALLAALADCSAVHEDPLADLDLPGRARSALAQRHADEVRALFAADRVTGRAWIEGAVTLAAALDVDWGVAAAGAAPALLAELLDRTGGHHEVFALIDRVAQNKLTAAVLQGLEAEFGRRGAEPVAALFVGSGPGRAWLAKRRLSKSTPLLQVVQAAGAVPGGLSGVALLGQVWREAGKPTEPGSMRVLTELTLPRQAGRPLEVEQALELTRLLPFELLAADPLGARCFEAFEHHAATARRETVDALAELGSAVARLGPSAAQSALADLAVEARRLLPGKAAGRPAEVTERAERLAAQAPAAVGLREVVVRSLAGGCYFFAAEADLHDERTRQTLISAFGGELLTAYHEAHRAPARRQYLLDHFDSRDEPFLAARFNLWFELAASPQQRVRDVGLALLLDLIEPTLGRISSRRARGVLKELGKSGGPRATESWRTHCAKHGLVDAEPQQSPDQGDAQQAAPPQPAVPENQ